MYIPTYSPLISVKSRRRFQRLLRGWGLLQALLGGYLSTVPRQGNTPFLSLSRVFFRP